MAGKPWTWHASRPTHRRLEGEHGNGEAQETPPRRADRPLYTTDKGALVYGGEAAVEAYFTDASGTVDGVSVSGGKGEFKGTLDHAPLQYNPDGPPILEGTLELTF